MKEDTTMESPVTEVIGLDLGDRVSVYVVLDANGEVEQEGQVRMTESALAKLFGSRGRARVALEAGAQSRWVAELLDGCGHEVVVANPRELRAISGSNNKNDRNDAYLLARLARVDVGLLKPVTPRNAEAQVDLLAIRARALAVRCRTMLSNGLRGMAKSFGVRLPRATSERYQERALAQLPEPMRAPLRGLMEMIAALTGGIDHYDAQIAEVARTRYPETAALERVPGVGTLTALTFVLTLDDPGRFRRNRDAGCYLGLRPQRKQSGGRDPQLGITHAGDSYLRMLLVQAAHCTLRKYAPDTALKRWGEKLCERGGKRAKKRALVAVARKLAVLLLRLWRTGEAFQAFPAAA